MPDTSPQKDCRIGVYICQCGGNISDVVNCAQVVAAAAELPNVVISREHSFMCSDPAQELIIEDINKNGLDRVIIASCSPSLHEITFRKTLERAGLNPFLYEHVNIREQVSWVHAGNPVGATQKATRLVQAAVNKARLLISTEHIQVKVVKKALVIGGGLAGLQTAKNLSEQGIQVTLLERSPFLGGHVAQLEKLFPSEENARDLLKPLISHVVESPLVEVITQAHVKAVDGYFGNFKVEVEVDPRYVQGPLSSEQWEKIQAACPVRIPDEFDYGLDQTKAIHLAYPGCVPAVPVIDIQHCTRCEKCEEILGENLVDFDEKPHKVEVNAGCIIMATGFKPYVPYEGEFGYGTMEGVITLAQFVRLLDKMDPDAGELVIDGKSIANVAMIHCVGSREIDGVHNPGPDRPLRTYCSRVCCSATLHATTEIRERFSDVNVFEIYRDIRSYGLYEECFEKASRNRVVFLKYSDYEIPKIQQSDGESRLTVTFADQLSNGQEIAVPADLIVLSSAMEPGDPGEIVNLMKLPIGQDGFLLEVHPKLRPVELSVAGVMVAGTAQAPMNTDEVAAAACAAAAKASRILTRSSIKLDPFVARVDATRCQGEGLCVEQCGYDGDLYLEDVENKGE